MSATIHEFFFSKQPPPTRWATGRFAKNIGPLSVTLTGVAWQAMFHRLMSLLTGKPTRETAKYLCKKRDFLSTLFRSMTTACGGPEKSSSALVGTF
jgi:hypothetical protein